MNWKQGIFVIISGIGFLLFLCCLLIMGGAPFTGALLAVLVSTGITGILMICLIGAMTIYENLR